MQYSEAITDKPFYDTSGGGVTLSDDKPLMFMDFASEILASLKKISLKPVVFSKWNVLWN